MVEHRIHFTRREQQNTLESHLLVPVSMNGRSGFLFSVEPTRSKTLVSARTIEALGINADSSSSLTISEKLVYPVVRLDSIGVATATVKDFEVVVWGRPVIPTEILASQDQDRLWHLGSSSLTDITSVIECRGVLGADFLAKFRVSLDFHTDTMMLSE